MSLEISHIDVRFVQDKEGGASASIGVYFNDPVSPVFDLDISVDNVRDILYTKFNVGGSTFSCSHIMTEFRFNEGKLTDVFVTVDNRSGVVCNFTVPFTDMTEWMCKWVREQISFDYNIGKED
jgi:hypothetical protein